MPIKRIGWILIYIGSGFSFWFPSIILHAVRKHHLGESPADIIAISLLPVVSSVITLETWARKRRGISCRGAVGLWILLGIWLLGPLCILIGGSFSGDPFNQPEAWWLITRGIPLFVPLTFMMSTYDMTLGALAVVTLAFMVGGIISLTHQWRKKHTGTT